MKLLLSGYNEGISLFNIDISKTSHKVEKLFSLEAHSPSFMCCDQINNIYFSFSKEEISLRLLSFKIINNKIYIIDEFPLPGTSITHLVYSHKHCLLIGCSYNDGTYFSVKVNKGFFIQILDYQKQSENENSKCHCVLLDKEENQVAITNISLDEIFIYDFVNDKLKYNSSIHLPQGKGPRHTIYSNNKMYVITEYSNEIIVIDMDNYNVMQYVTTLNNFNGKSNGATLLINNHKLYASNRGENTIAVFDIDINGLIKYSHSFSCFGDHPRHMIMIYDNKTNYLLSCNKNENELSIINLQTEKEEERIPFIDVSSVLKVEE